MAANSKSLPPGSHNAPGSESYRRLQGAPRVAPKVIDKSFLANPKGGPEMVAGKAHIEARDNRTRSPR
jgi:hypothetical protein